MDVNEFQRRLEKLLQLDPNELTLETNLRDVDGFDSMSLLSLMAFVDSNFNKTLSADALRTVTTIQSLIQVIGPERFAA